MYLICSVPLISWQPKKVCWFTIHNNQTKYNKGAYTDSNILTYTITRHPIGGWGWGYFASQATNFVKLSMVMHYHEPARLSSKKIGLLSPRSRSQEMFKIPVTVQLDDISWTAVSFVTKLGVVMLHHGPECHASRLVCCFQVQGLSEGLYN